MNSWISTFKMKMKIIWLFSLIALLGSCCPKISTTSVTTVRTDTIFVPRIDTVTVSVVDTFRTGLLIDSLLDFLNNEPQDNTTLSQSNSGGVRTRIVYRDRMLIAECNIDSLRAAVVDSLMMIVKDSTTVITNVVERCPYYKFPFKGKAGHALMFILVIVGCIGIAGLVIVLGKK